MSKILSTLNNVDMESTNLNGIGTVYTKGSIPFANAAGALSQDNANFNYNPTGVFGGPAVDVGPQGANPGDAVFEVYAAVAGTPSAHFHNNGVQGPTNGGIVNINCTPTGTPAAIASGNQLGSLQWGGTFDNTLAIQTGPAINAFATQTWSSTQAGSKVIFNTVPNGSLVRTLALTLDQDQSATFTGTLQANGYKAADTSPGISTTITTALLVGKTITVKNGLITGFV